MKKNITILILSLALGHYISVYQLQKERMEQVKGLVEIIVSALEPYEKYNNMGIVGSINQINEGLNDSSRTRKRDVPKMAR